MATAQEHTKDLSRQLRRCISRMVSVSETTILLIFIFLTYTSCVWQKFVDLVRVSKRSQNLKDQYFGATIPFIYLSNPLGFPSVKNTIKSLLFKTSGLAFHTWLFRPEKVLGTSEKQAPDNHQITSQIWPKTKNQIYRETLQHFFPLLETFLIMNPHN